MSNHPALPATAKPDGDWEGRRYAHEDRQDTRWIGGRADRGMSQAWPRAAAGRDALRHAAVAQAGGGGPGVPREPRGIRRGDRRAVPARGENLVPLQRAAGERTVQRGLWLLAAAPA